MRLARPLRPSGLELTETCVQFTEGERASFVDLMGLRPTPIVET